MTALTNSIINAANSSEDESLIQEFSFSTTEQNQLLLFFKPEVFMVGDAKLSAKIINMGMQKFEEFGVQVSGCLLLSGTRLAELEIMDRHYGYINQMSKKASMALSDDDKNELYRLTDSENGTPILGGHEFLLKNNQFSPQSLDSLWASKKSLRIRSGLYAQVFDVNGESIILINGFHPEQLAHFTMPDRKIVLLLLHSNTPWKALRSRMLGDTFPEKALLGSIRRTLNENSDKYGLDHVTIANNCVHLSAGPFEALFELNNFLSRTESVNFSIDSVNVAQLFKKANVGENSIQSALKNPQSTINESKVSLFDATEDLDTLSSVEMFRLFYT